ncbi:hypothetical protein JMN32_26795 [Fulvivirga sp. 29W222]|uniref:Uncharacterized protein n=1 Tax=Fulvivirga marina TaxID=2494733 RepID=A0A937G195_9BACT|nr:hypothetical protein [Fulvivirga marina]MBL6449950.1 hypothetical protein [Fulvivirga marina]
MITTEELQEEFNNLANSHEAMKTAALQNDGLVEMAAKHPLYEIEPFFSELNNEFNNGQHSFLLESDDFDPEKDDLYTLWINMDQRRAFYRVLHLGGGVSYETVFEYHEGYYKSATVFINKDEKKPIKLAYLYFKEEMPDLYMECSSYGAFTKKYHSQEYRLDGYKLTAHGNDYEYDVQFEYNYDGALERITGKGKDNDSSRIIFQRPDERQNMTDTLATIEEQLVEEITDQIQKKIKIDGKVYCILLEYTMQGPFPPTVAIGLESEIDGTWDESNIGEYYNAPDMHYFSEADTLPIDLYSEELEKSYIFFDQNYDIMDLNVEEFDQWETQVKEIYLRVCKRIIHMDFSMSFKKTDNFLVIARDFEACNEEYYYQEMMEYKREKGL